MHTILKKQIGVLTLFILLNTGFVSYSQFDAYRFSSPESASQGTNVSGIDMYRGRNNVSIPICNYQGREMNLPISISNSSVGVKVEQIASTVGLGWDLNVGGRIIRMTNRSPDDEYPSGSGAHASGCFVSENYGYEAYQVKDYYTLSLPGFNDVLRFFQPGTILSMTNPKTQVEITSAGNGTGNGIWTVTADDGTQYFFGKGNAKEIIKTYKGDVPTCEMSSTNAYLLNKIVSKNKLDVYIFTYTTFEWAEPIFTKGEERSDQPNTPKSSYKTNQGVISAIYHNGQKIIGFNYKPREDLTFVGGTQVGNALSDIVFYDYKKHDVYKKVVFNHSYFGKLSTSDYRAKRLKLTDIVWHGFDKNTQDFIEGDKYSFGYASESIEMPSLDSRARDYLGLYNAQDGNSSLIDGYGCSREYNFQASLVGTLNKVTYPTGGYSEFEFEQNSTAIGGFGTTTIPANDIPHAVIYPHFMTCNQMGTAFGDFTGCYLGISGYEDWHTLMRSPFPNPFTTLLNPLCTGVQTAIMRIDQTNNYQIDVDGNGIYLIHKIDETNCDGEDTTAECNIGSIAWNPCLVNPQDIVYLGGATIGEDIGGITNNGGYGSSNTRFLAQGTYQVTLWRYIDYTEVGIPELPGAGIRIYRYESETEYTHVPEQVIDHDVYIPNFDGFRIKGVTNYASVGKVAGKKLYKYITPYVCDEVANTFQYSTDLVPFTHHPNNVNVKTSRGYVSPEIIHYFEVDEIAINADTGEDIGLVKYNFEPESTALYLCTRNTRPFDYKSQARDPILITYVGNSKDFLIQKRIYDKLRNVVSDQLFEYPDVNFHLPSCYSPAGPQTDYFVTYKMYPLAHTTETTHGVFNEATLTYNDFLPFDKTTTTGYEYYIYGHPETPRRLTGISTDKGEVHSVYAQYPVNVRLFPETTTSAPQVVQTHLIQETQSAKSGFSLQIDSQYEYDEDGNRVTTIKYTSGTITPASLEAVIYGYNNLPVARISGLRYSDIPPSLISAIKSATAIADNDTNVAAALDALRTNTTFNANFPNMMITTYMYNPVYGVTMVTDPKGYSLYYEYDAFGRLQFTKEKTPNGDYVILSENQYHTRN